MAAKWEGFTEDDIKHYLDHNADSSSATEQAVKPKAVSLRNGSVKKQVIREKNMPARKSSAPQVDIPESACLLQRLEMKATAEPAGSSHIPLEPNVLISTNPILPAADGNVEAETEVDPAKRLEMFQVRQKLLEEQNRQRKQFLTKLLTDRKKQTTEEARRLQKIQEELQKLDILLSNDVGILRDEIEVASAEFGEAQKRFNRAEKEFLEAKQVLFGKLERKELLTKHLCTIIEQNEVRKAQKLSELMSQLDPSALEAIDSKLETSITPEKPHSSPDVAASPGVS